MKGKIPPNRISELRLARQWSQQELADKVPAHSVTMSKLERGEMQLTQAWMKKIAKALGVQPQELLSDSPLERTIFVDGWIEKAGLVRADKSDEEITTVAFTIDIGTKSPASSLWYFAMAGVFPPSIHVGDALRFTYYPDMDANEHINRICIVHFADERPSIVGILRRGANAEIFDLTLPTGETQEGLVVDYISVLSMVVSSPRFPQGFEI